jgi:hypothetical protein
MDYFNIFPFNNAYDSYNGDFEILVKDEEYRQALYTDYKERFCNNKDG